MGKVAISGSFFHGDRFVVNLQNMSLSALEIDSMKDKSE